jgi:pyruvate/2-oxoglutarate dehydrogenase complex dihydrolipoamide acyltransferase (E2) component
LTENQEDGVLNKLNQGLQESREMVQKQTMELAQEYFDDSAEALGQQIEENRAMLEGLPDQIPGRDEAFQMLFQELMDNYAAMERCINDARGNVAGLDTERLRRQGEVDATDAARREAREQNVDLTEIEGTGSEGRVIADDVKNSPQWTEGLTSEGGGATDAARREAQNIAEQTTPQAQEMIGQTADRIGEVASQMQSATGQVAAANRESGASKATGAARRRADKQGVNLSSVEGTGPGGLITLKDVMDA